jgi:hypothetical protein
MKRGASLIVRVLKEKAILKKDFFRPCCRLCKSIKEQVLAANFDYVFIVDSLIEF